MAREVTAELAILNIKSHPHSPEKYIKILEFAKQQRLLEHLSPERVGMFGLLSKPREGVLAGEIFTFIKVDKNDPWFDVGKGEVAEKDEVSREVSIPEHLKPHMKEIPFVFFADAHRLVFQTTFGPTTVSRLVGKILGSEKVKKQFELDSITVVLEQSRGALEQIWHLHQLKELSIVISRPNADDWKTLEKEYEERMEEEQLSKVEEKITVQDNKTITPSERTKALATLALKDGHVSARGRETSDSRVKALSTRRTVERVAVRYDPDKLSVTEAIIENADEVLRKGRDYDEPAGTL